MRNMKTFVNAAFLLICLLSEKSRAMDGEDPNLQRSDISAEKRDLMATACARICVASGKCYSDQEIDVIVDDVMNKSANCKDILERECHSYDLSNTQINKTCVRLVFGEIDECQPDSENHHSRQDACDECRHNCTAVGEEPEVGGGKAEEAESSGDFEARVVYKTTRGPEPTTSTPSFMNVTECANHCGQSDQCNLTIGTEGLLLGKSGRCTKCVPWRCRDKSEYSIDCNVCNKLEKMTCYVRALRECWTCSDAPEAVEDNLEKCDRCMERCIEKYGNDEESHQKKEEVEEQPKGYYVLPWWWF